VLAAFSRLRLAFPLFQAEDTPVHSLPLQRKIQRANVFRLHLGFVTQVQRHFKKVNI